MEQLDDQQNLNDQLDTRERSGQFRNFNKTPHISNSKLCSFYSNYGFCKFGQNCKFLHRRKYSSNKPAQIKSASLKSDASLTLPQKGGKNADAPSREYNSNRTTTHKNHQKRTCRYYRAGHCEKGENCLYNHNLDSYNFKLDVTVPKNRKDHLTNGINVAACKKKSIPICHYFRRGSCLKGGDIQEFYSYVPTNGLFRGVFAADQIPDLGPGPAWIIVNTAISSTRGEHWIVIGFDNHLLYFFDSFGLPPTTFNSYISSFASRYHCYYNDVCFQDFKTEVCGYYTIFVIVRIAEGRSHCDIRRELEECGNSDNYVEQQVKATYQKAVERSKLPSLFGSGICVLLYVLILWIAFYLTFNSTQMIRSKCNPRTYSDYAMYDDHMMDID